MFWKIGSHFRDLQSVLARLVSDHALILLDGVMRKGKTPYKFEIIWPKAEGFIEQLKVW